MEGIPIVPPGLDLRETLPYYSATIGKGEVFKISNIDELPEVAVNERAITLAEGIKASLTVPMVAVILRRGYGLGAQAMVAGRE